MLKWIFKRKKILKVLHFILNSFSSLTEVVLFFSLTHAIWRHAMDGD